MKLMSKFRPNRAIFGLTGFSVRAIESGSEKLWEPDLFPYSQTPQ